MARWDHWLNQLASDVVAALEYSPYEWTHELRPPKVDGLLFRGDRFVASQQMTVVMDDPDAAEGSGVTLTKTITLRKFMGALRAVCANHRIPVDRECGGEIDADLADQILQLAVYGQVFFG
jgi:hypothetical protein